MRERTSRPTERRWADVVEIVVGTVLVLLTWAVMVSALGLAGSGVASLAAREARLPEIFRTGLWWGLGILVLLASAISLFSPLRSAESGLVTVAVIGTLAVVGSVALRRVPRTRQTTWRRPSVPVLALLGSVGLVLVYVAARALGPINNYDSGLYHLGAIGYAGDVGTIPGLANLHFPLGYANSLFPLAALLGNGPWDGVGYRLVNGLVLTLVVVDLTVRLLTQRRWSWGTWILLASTGSVFIPVIAITDFWVTSPTADTTILLLSVAASAYLADAVSAGQSRALSGTVTGVVVITMVTMRPTMVAFAGAALLVLLILGARSRGTGTSMSASGWVLVGGFGLLASVIEVLRDYRLSGWLLYPLSILPLGPAWAASDPISVREPTLSVARTLGRPDHGVVARSWDWIPGWFGRSVSQWETWFLLLGVLVLLALLVLVHHRGQRLRWKAVSLVMLPSALGIAVWFLLSPPSYRFGWGPLFTLLLIPIGAALATLASGGGETSRWRAGVLLSVTTLLIALTAFSAVTRTPWSSVTEPRQWTLGPITLPYAVTPIPLPPTQTVMTEGGITLVQPVESDQCWGHYPLCTPIIEPGLTPRGPALADGFVR